MYMRMSWGSLRPGSWDDYRRYYLDRVVPSTKAISGLRQRQLLRSTENSDEGISLSTWESLDDLMAYERSESRRGLLREVEHLHHPLAYPRGEYWVKHFEVVNTFP